MGSGSDRIYTVLVIRSDTPLCPSTLPIPGNLCSSQALAQKAHHMIGAFFKSLSMYKVSSCIFLPGMLNFQKS
jgi:hypothetical protein